MQIQIHPFSWKMRRPDNLGQHPQKAMVAGATGPAWALHSLILYHPQDCIPNHKPMLAAIYHSTHPCVFLTVEKYFFLIQGPALIHCGGQLGPCRHLGLWRKKLKIYRSLA